MSKNGIRSLLIALAIGLVFWSGLAIGLVFWSGLAVEIMYIKGVFNG
ncbi:TPA: hypothetical protein OMI77_004152 [Klebsiella pneumoniae]|nr:hypothetical protein [Klebsiella pneumoniae]SLQ79442.1 Uncharacterised protein [Klebsiella pneumoniae]HBR6060788.1 hypothetical protein [Klebsiella pneumoniae]HCQ8827937.1 hypothetical protein [Klebsiella pneumoniae]HCQ8983531.1 hypothetical protein [Klebsiella pneumoniae]HCQ9080012.1 hypothetical protein [Klebsiella pneumoniae]